MEIARGRKSRGGMDDFGKRAKAEGRIVGTSRTSELIK